MAACLALGTVGGILANGLLLVVLSTFWRSETRLSVLVAFVAAVVVLVPIPLAQALLLNRLFPRVPGRLVALGYVLPLLAVFPFYLSHPIHGDLMPVAVALLALFGYCGGRLLVPEPPSRGPRCPKCDYLLFHATEQRCPECGRMFKIEELDMRLGRWDGQVLKPREEGVLTADEVR